LDKFEDGFDRSKGDLPPGLSGLFGKVSKLFFHLFEAVPPVLQSKATQSNI
jgi:hypothetical protein